jgi:hypothetical protein
MSHRRCVDRCAWTTAVSVCLVFLVTATIARADVVVPTPDVTTSVSVRASASAQSASVGTLHPGEQATLVGTVSNWYRVQLANVFSLCLEAGRGSSRAPPPHHRPRVDKPTPSMWSMSEQAWAFWSGLPTTPVYDAGST